MDLRGAEGQRTNAVNSVLSICAKDPDPTANASNAQHS